MASIITAAEARRWIPGLTGTTEDTILEDLIDAADSALAEFLGYPYPRYEDPPDSRGRTLLKAIYHLYLEGNPAEPKMLRLGALPSGHPSDTIPTVHIDSSWVWGSDTQLTHGVDFDYAYPDLRADGRFVLRPGGSYGSWPTALRCIKVVTNLGYDAGETFFDDLPKDIQVACGLLVAHWWQLRHTSGLTNVSQAGGSAGLVSGAIPDNVKQLMEPYRISGNWLG